MENAGIGIHVKNGQVHLVLFGQDADIGFTPEQARELGQTLIDAAEIADDQG